MSDLELNGERLIVPDEFEPHIAYRCWRVVPVDGRLRLGSITHVSQIWKPREEMVAHCQMNREHPEGVPDVQCSCGIYATKTIEEACRHANYAEPFVAIGEIKIWGKLVDCQIGYKAHKAYPAKLYLWPNTPAAEKAWEGAASRLEKAYGVPVYRAPFDPQNQGRAVGLPAGKVIRTGKSNTVKGV